MEKILDINNLENVVVDVTFRGSDNQEYECAGVFLGEGGDVVRIAFNAKNDKVTDYLDINISDVISIKMVDQFSIRKL